MKSASFGRAMTGGSGGALSDERTRLSQQITITQKMIKRETRRHDTVFITTSEIVIAKT
jgi:hypothetical protein